MVRMMPLLYLVPMLVLPSRALRMPLVVLLISCLPNLVFPPLFMPSAGCVSSSSICETILSTSALSPPVLLCASLLWCSTCKLPSSHRFSSSLPIHMDSSSWKGLCMCLSVLSSWLSSFCLSLLLGVIGVSLISRVLTQLGSVLFGFGYEHHLFIIFLSAYFVPFVVEHPLVSESLYSNAEAFNPR